LLIPLQGDVDDLQGEALCSDVLQAIERSRISGLVIDVTGLWLMDSHLCSVLSILASSAALMGTRTVICGLSPQIAITLQTMGLDMPDVATVPCLEDAVGLLGVTHRADPYDDDDSGEDASALRFDEPDPIDPRNARNR
jgi:rsbT antagonist protein RsbS